MTAKIMLIIRSTNSHCSGFTQLRQYFYSLSVSCIFSQIILARVHLAFVVIATAIIVTIKISYSMTNSCYEVLTIHAIMAQTRNILATTFLSRILCCSVSALRM